MSTDVCKEMKCSLSREIKQEIVFPSGIPGESFHAA